MSPKLTASALGLLVILSLLSTVEAHTGVEAKHSTGSTSEPNAGTGGTTDSTATARRVFEGSQFWWKHRSKVEDPMRELGFFASLRRPIEAILSFFGRMLSQVFRFLRWLMPTSIPGLGAVTGASSGLLWGLGAVSLAVLSLIVYQILRRSRFAADHGPAERLAEPQRLPDALILMTRAKAALEAGDTFKALRLGFQAVLAGLEDRGIVRYNPARTNSEYLRDLRPQPALAADFRRIALPFDRAFYGNIRPEPVDVERALEFCQRLMSVRMGST